MFSLASIGTLLISSVLGSLTFVGPTSHFLETDAFKFVMHQKFFSHVIKTKTDHFFFLFSIACYIYINVNKKTWCLRVPSEKAFLCQFLDPGAK